MGSRERGNTHTERNIILFYTFFFVQNGCSGCERNETTEDGVKVKDVHNKVKKRSERKKREMKAQGVTAPETPGARLSNPEISRSASGIWSKTFAVNASAFGLPLVPLSRCVFPLYLIARGFVPHFLHLRASLELAWTTKWADPSSSATALHRPPITLLQKKKKNPYQSKRVIS